MTIKTIAGRISMLLIFLAIALFFIWVGSFLEEWRLVMGILAGIIAVANLFFMIVEWSYSRGEKAGRDSIE